MYTFFNIVLIVIAILFFIMGYVFLTDKEEIIMWSYNDKLKKVKDKAKYKKYRGKYSIVMGTIFLLVPVSVYFIDVLELNKKLLYIWYAILVIVIVSNIVQEKKYFK
ncbi:DUF3784 domain-containing protein [Clostridiisalibacter paucivorans]|uniref:DUF3784 domain-containing protein n=1 Tax=Clostridiisalibacter paucivorans TaxID=408753 RepID=UPI00047A3EB3|nr:DUF3784 domain-containing protein [Clostridiisalibacter paucivorans]